MPWISTSALDAIRETARDAREGVQLANARAEAAVARYHELAAKLIDRSTQPSPAPPTAHVANEPIPAEERAMRRISEDTIKRAAQHMHEQDGVPADMAMAEAERLFAAAEGMSVDDGGMLMFGKDDDGAFGPPLVAKE